MERVVSELMELLGYLLVGGAFLVNLVLAFFRAQPPPVGFSGR